MPKRPDDRKLMELRATIDAANKAYRKGEPILSDAEYDVLVEKLEGMNPSDPLLSTIGGEPIAAERKRKLEGEMASMNKAKTLDELQAWMVSKGIPYDAELIAMPKYDGCSGQVNEQWKKGNSRGDGVYGQSVDELYCTCAGYVDDTYEETVVVGEFIMSKAAWAKWALVPMDNGKLPSNARALVNGAVIRGHAKYAADVDYLRYGLAQGQDMSMFTTKAELIDWLNAMQPVPVPYTLFKADELTEAELYELYEEWSTEYYLDGVIVEVNNLRVQERLGRETNGNPAYARAFKGDFEELATVEVLGVEWNISKQGYYKPIVQVEPVSLDGVTVSNITGNNARYVQTMGIGKGALVTIKRSGMVIPQVVAVEKRAPHVELPQECYHCGTELEWLANNRGERVELMCENEDCYGREFKKALSFLRLMGVENVSEGILDQLWSNGFDSLHRVLSASVADLAEVDRFGKRKAEIVYNSIHDKLIRAPMPQLMHASGCFKGLGSTKLALVCDMEDPTLEELMEVDGFSRISAESYLRGLEEFNKFRGALPVVITIDSAGTVLQTGNSLAGKVFCFTGFRNNNWEQYIRANGGTYKESLTKQTTHLVMKEKGSGTTKEQKALKYGATIMTREEFEEWICSLD